MLVSVQQEPDQGTETGVDQALAHVDKADVTRAQRHRVREMTLERGQVPGAHNARGHLEEAAAEDDWVGEDAAVTEVLHILLLGGGRSTQAGPKKSW